MAVKNKIIPINLNRMIYWLRCEYLCTIGRFMIFKVTVFKINRTM